MPEGYDVAKGLQLTSGEAIRASWAVLAGLHVRQVLPDMAPGVTSARGLRAPATGSEICGLPAAGRSSGPGRNAAPAALAAMRRG
jgi:hypothetical protein